MIKIMLVEDDKSLREIYGVRLLAEGYDIVSAGDGEEALAMAIKERPQLIISDVMMPKVSGYDMLDILRSTTETKNIRVIMMTALSSEEQRMRAESLGADRYLVKSQVGIEDVVRVVHEVLEDVPGATSSAPAPVAPSAPAPAAVPPRPATMPIAAPSAAPIIPPRAPAPVTPTPAASPIPVSQPPITPFPTPAPQPVAPAVPTVPISDSPKPASLKTRVIQPLSDPSVAPVNISDLLDKELAKEAGIADSERPVVPSLNQEKALVEEQLHSFTPPELTPVTPPAPVAPVAQNPVISALPVPGISPVTPPPVPPAPVAPTMPVVQPLESPSNIASSNAAPTTLPDVPKV